MSGVTLSSEISWEEKRGEERRDFDEDGMDGDASAACLFSFPLLVSIFLLPVDRGREKNPFVTFWGKRVREKWVCGRGGGTIRDFNAFGPYWE